jgi:hypothetical protein
MPATKVDLERERAALYRAGLEPVLVEVPELPYLMTDGTGDPNGSPAFVEAIEVLFRVARGLKLAVRRKTGLDYTVMPLEALWWADGVADLATAERSSWRWTAMIAQPGEVTASLVQETIAAVRAQEALRGLERLRFERLVEADAAQLLHVGPYAAEGPSIARLHEFIAACGLRPRGAQHEIYLGEPGRASPERLKTVIRQPVERVSG